jgi:hypothetical protein
LIAGVIEKDVRRDDLDPADQPDYEDEEIPVDAGEELAAALDVGDSTDGGDD